VLAGTINFILEIKNPHSMNHQQLRNVEINI